MTERSWRVTFERVAGVEALASKLRKSPFFLRHDPPKSITEGDGTVVMRIPCTKERSAIYKSCSLLTFVLTLLKLEVHQPTVLPRMPVLSFSYIHLLYQALELQYRNVIAIMFADFQSLWQL